MIMNVRATRRRIATICGNLFGCGDEKGTGVVGEDIKDAAFNKTSADRLLHQLGNAREGRSHGNAKKDRCA